MNDISDSDILDWIERYVEGIFMYVINGEEFIAITYLQNKELTRIAKDKNLRDAVKSAIKDRWSKDALDQLAEQAQKLDMGYDNQ